MELRAACDLRPDSTRARFELALTRQLAGDLDEARAGYLSVLNADPTHITALAGLGQISRQSGDLPAALEYLQKAASLDPARLGLQCDTASVLCALSRLDEARIIYQSVLANCPTHVAALAGLGQVDRQRGNLRCALDYIQRAASLDPARIGLQCDAAAVLCALSRLEEARAAYESVLATHPTHVAALAGLGQISRQSGDLPAALKYLRQAASIDPSRMGLQCDAAAVLCALSRFDEARAAYESVLAAHPAHVTALIGLGHVNRQSGDLTAALEYLRRAATLDPSRLRLKCDAAAVLCALGRFDEAQTDYQSILQQDADNVDALIGLGLVERQRGDYEASLAFFQAGLTGHPEHDKLKAHAAAAFRLLDRLDEAESLYKSAVQRDPRDATSMRGLAQIAAARGQYDAAIEYTQTACALDPLNIDTRLSLAALNRDIGRVAEATAIVEEILAAAPNHPGALIEQGLILRSRDERTLALAAFQRAANLNRERGWIEAAAEHLALGQTEKARVAYQAVLTATPDQYDAMMGLVGLQMMAGDHLKCIETCDALIAKYPKRLAPTRQKCQALIQLDRVEEALRIVSGLQSTGPLLPEIDGICLEIFRTCGMRSEAMALVGEPRVATTKVFQLWFQRVLTQLAFFDLIGVEAALEIAPAHRLTERSRVIYLRGRLADLQWRVSDSIALFESALEIHGYDASSHDNLARLYWLRADVKSVSRHLQTMISQSVSRLSLRGQSTNISQNVIGQMLNELKLDPPLCDHLARLLKKDPQQQIEALSEFVRSHVTLTPPAVYLLLALRQSGNLDISTPVSVRRRASKSLIPLSIMQYWDQTKPPESIVALFRTWVEAHPGYQYCRFDNTSAREYLASHYPKEVLRAYRRASHPAQASDLFRLAYLFHQGGFYVDADDRCTASLSSIKSESAQLITYQEQFATLGNNFLGCVAQEPVIGRALNLAVEALNRGDNDTIWLATGPGLLTRAFAQVFADQGVSWREWLKDRWVLERKDLAEITWPHAILQYKNTQQSWLRQTFKSRTAQSG